MAKNGLTKATDIDATPDRVTFETYGSGEVPPTPPVPPEPPVEPSNLVGEAKVGEAKAG